MYKVFKLKDKALIALVMCLVMVLCNTACKDIFEDELSDEKIVLLSPANNDTLNNTVQTFWWQELEDDIAFSNYKVELVSPSFDNVKRTILDTIMLKNKFDFSLISLEKNESYQWRVRAENNSSKTPYTTASFFMSNEVTLSREKLKLNSPNSGDSLDLRTSRFEWQKMDGAERYIIQIDDQLGAVFGYNINSLEINKPVVDNFYKKGDNLIVNQTYYWRVRAVGKTSSNVSQWSEVREVIIKRTK